MERLTNKLKPMTVVTTTGYVISVLGTYLTDGKNDDSSIMQTDAKEILEWFENEDISIVARSF